MNNPTAIAGSPTTQAQPHLLAEKQNPNSGAQANKATEQLPIPYELTHEGIKYRFSTWIGQVAAYRYGERQIVSGYKGRTDTTYEPYLAVNLRGGEYEKLLNWSWQPKIPIAVGNWVQIVQVGREQIEDGIDSVLVWTNLSQNHYEYFWDPAYKVVQMNSKNWLVSCLIAIGLFIPFLLSGPFSEWRIGIGLVVSTVLAFMFWWNIDKEEKKTARPITEHGRRIAEAALAKYQALVASKATAQ